MVRPKFVPQLVWPFTASTHPAVWHPRRPARALSWPAAALAVAIAPAATQTAAPPSQGHRTAATSPAARVEARALTTLLDRATATQPGTYLVSGDELSPLSEPVPVFVQADALPGPDRTVRGAIALGARVTQPASTRVKVVSIRASERRVVSDVSGSAAAGVVRAVDLVTLQPGEYEVLAAVAEARGGGAIAALTTSRLVVPDLRRGDLALGPVVLGDAVAATPAASRHSPFVFGPTAIRPAADNRFGRSGDLHVGFRIYNWSAPDGTAPDLLAEYVFHEGTSQGDRFFNKVKPQPLNGDTLGAGFDASAGVVNSGMTIPLDAFPIGDFQVTVRVTDNRTKRTVSQASRFNVVP